MIAPLSICLADTDDVVVQLWRTTGGVVLLRIEAECEVRDFLPSDKVGEGGTVGGAARLVAAVAAQPQRSNEEIVAARAFLRQWPQGPQV